MGTAHKKEYCIELREKTSGFSRLLGIEIIFETEKNSMAYARKLKREYLNKGHKNVEFTVYEHRPYNHLFKIDDETKTKK